jgi:hypothetical protein
MLFNFMRLKWNGRFFTAEPHCLKGVSTDTLVGYYISYVVFFVPFARAGGPCRARPSALRIAGLYSRAARYMKSSIWSE